MLKRTFLTAVAALLAAGAAQAQGLRVFVGGAMTGPVREMAAGLDPPAEIVSDTTGGLQRRLLAGEAADVMVMTASALDAMQAKGIAAGGRAPLARALIGVGVKAGAPAPDISTTAGLKAALLSAHSVAYVNPAAGGTSGTYFEGLLQRLGIADEVRPKTVYQTQGSEVAAAVAAGRAEIGITFTSEMAPNPGVRIVGPLPDEVQMPTIYSAALSAKPPHPQAAAAFLRRLASPAGMAAVRRASLEPLTGGVLH